MSTTSTNRRGNVVIVILAFILALCAIVPVGLHFAQKRHNRLPLDVARQYPAQKPIVSGEVFAAALRAIMEHELSTGSGWRPNDFFLWGPALWADNNANRQLGIIQAVRESTRVFKDHLTKVSANEFDQNLVIADTAFRNDAAKFWLPSAEFKFHEGAQALGRYLAGLKTTPRRARRPTDRQDRLAAIPAVRL